MNSILHTATNSNSGALERMTESQMYSAIFNYIDHLFDIIKPKEVFYMAIDGVAPRAKMNQQRARRFRTAIEAEQSLRKAIDEGLDIPKEDPFDKNAITPGTEFMAKLTKNLKYFIHKKMSEDARWSKVKVILSGHEVPGEGEHKIMQYIRSIKSQDNYNANTRHCIYGLDADLIVLGLVTHDPHFSILREEVVFNSRANKALTDVLEQKFYLLQLSLLREYLGLEFQDLNNKLSFGYDFERILDDFILIMYVIGNDFLPHLPDLHINKGAFPLLIAAFKQSIMHMDGYLNEGGKINFKRLSIWLEYLSEFELEVFESQNVDVDWFNKRIEDISISGERKRERTGKTLILQDEKELVSMIQPWLLENACKPVNELIALANEDKLQSFKVPTDLASKYLMFLKKLALETGFLLVHSQSNDTYEATIDVDGISPYENEEEFGERIADIKKTLQKYQSANTFATDELMKEAKDLYDSKFVEFKTKYYKEKLHFTSDKQITDFARHYCEGLQWVLYYYYKGCPSWSWFFRFHYSPRISDITKGINDMFDTNEEDVKFDYSQPFKPFEQLMAVLPARSRKLMPAVYRPLMTDEHSPIIDFYPNDVEMDLNGKTASWEAVVLIDFVDEKRLLEVLKPIEAKLTPEETKRNSHGEDIRFVFSPQVDQIYPTPLPGFYHDLEHDNCYEETLHLKTILPNFKFTLPKKAKLGKNALAGFPSLYTIPFTSKLALLEVKIFNFPSKSESMILTIENKWKSTTVSQVAHVLLGKVIYANWPFLEESKLCEVWEKGTKYESVRNVSGKSVVASDLSPQETSEFNKLRSSLVSSYAKEKGVILGPVNAIAFVQKVTGLARTQRGALAKSFSPDKIAFPLQTIVETVRNKDQRLITRGAIAIDKEYPVDMPVVFLGAFAYGAPATVAGHTDDKLNLKIDKILSALEPTIGKKRLAIEKKEIKYFPASEIAKTLGVSPLFLSKIAGSYMLKDKGGKMVNVGLNLKFEARRQKVMGYTRKYLKFWQYSLLALELLKKYQKQFPDFFNKLQKIPQNRDMPPSSEVCDDKELSEIQKWLKHALAPLQRVSLESEQLTRFSVTAIEDSIQEFISRPVPLDKKDVKGVPVEAVINPHVSSQLLNAQKFELGDRIIYVSDTGKVPKLSKGTIVGINTEGELTSLSIVFDHALVGGNNMGGRLKTNRGCVVESSQVLNITVRQLVYHSNASKSKKMLSNAERSARFQKIEDEKVQAREAAPKHGNGQGTKSSNELLTLLKKGSKDGEAEKATEAKGDEKSSQEDADGADVKAGPSAIKQIYGQIYNNVMFQGAVPAPMPGAPYGQPFQQPGPEYAQVPGIPLPPQFVQQQPPNYPVQQPYVAGSNSHPAFRPEFAPEDGQTESKPRGWVSGRGRGTGRGRGGGRGGRGRGGKPQA